MFQLQSASAAKFPPMDPGESNATFVQRPSARRPAHSPQTAVPATAKRRCIPILIVDNGGTTNVANLFSLLFALA